MFDEGVHIETSGRVRVERGPVSMVVSAWADGEARPDACLAAAARVDELLAGLASIMPLLSRPWPLTSAADFGAHEGRAAESGRAQAPADNLGLAMWLAARATGHPEMTPLCAVAGAVSDAVADAAVAALEKAAVVAALEEGAGAGGGKPSGLKVIVNNGGDVTLRLGPGLSASVGLVPALTAAGADETIIVDAASPVRGVATSGLGGRGMTQGVADSVSVFAASGALADALATRLCNASRIDSPNVSQALAGSLRPGCDIAQLPVTVAVGSLTEAEKTMALAGVRTAALPLMEAGIVYALRATVQGKVLWMPGVFH